MTEIFKDWKCPEGRNIVLMGSCFSDNLTPYLEQADYRVHSNPFGTLFHPIPILNWIDMAIVGNIDEERLQIVFHENQWKSLCGGKELRDESKKALLLRIEEKLLKFRAALVEANILVLTLGTAHAWLHKDFGIVGNCQRLPNSEFKRELIPLQSMLDNSITILDKVNRINPFLQIVFTVSPVKHWRMGIIENSRTKARCVELVHALKAQRSLNYFPSYEYVTDVLRNDEFYEEDRCHPNKECIQLVAQSFLLKRK